MHRSLKVAEPSSVSTNPANDHVRVYGSEGKHEEVEKAVGELWPVHAVDALACMTVFDRYEAIDAATTRPTYFTSTRTRAWPWLVSWLKKVRPPLELAGLSVRRAAVGLVDPYCRAIWSM